jgi:hypothetical protein
MDSGSRGLALGEDEGGAAHSLNGLPRDATATGVPQFVTRIGMRT